MLECLAAQDRVGEAEREVHENYYVVVFDGGDLILIGGNLSTNQTITASPTTSEFIIRNSSGTIFALADLSTGDFKLKGNVYEEVSSLSPPDHCLVVKGVNSKLCYLLTDGDDFRGRTITGLGIGLVADLYYYCQLHLLSGADHADLYEMLTEAAITLGCTDSQRRNIEEACRAVEIRPTKSVAFKNSAGATLAQLTDGGDLILIGGDLLTNQTITSSPTAREFIVKISGTILALLDLSTGNFKLKGKVYEVVASPTPPSKCFVVKQDTRVVSFVTSSAWTNPTLEPTYPYTVPAGSLILTGHVVSVDEE